MPKFLSMYKSLKRVAPLLGVLVFINITPYIAVRLLANFNAIQIFSEPAVPAIFNGKLRVATYNIAHGRGGVYGADNWNHDSAEQREARLLSIAQFIKEQDIDVLILNEVDFDAHWSHNLNQAQFIAKNAGLPYRVEQTNYHLYHPLFKLKFGNAILSKYPINSARLLTFDPLSKLEDIAFGNHDGAIVTLNLGESDRGHKTVSIVALHLEVRDRNSRLKTFEKLEHLLLEQKIPTILAGDLNSIKSTDGTNRSIIDKLTALHGVEYYPNQLSSSPLFTFPTEAPSKTLDWIVTSPNVSLMDGKIATVLWSDHLPVIATLMLH